jgi:SET domain-containing protein
VIISLVQTQNISLNILPSKIHGLGLFALDDIPAGTLVYESNEYSITPHAIYASIQRTPSEHLLEKTLRWENHSCEPNSIIQFYGNKIKLFSIDFIAKGKEIVCNYRIIEDSIPEPFYCNCGNCNGILIS